MIKKFHEFILESNSGKHFEYGCVMIYPKLTDWKNITSMMKKEDVYEPENPVRGIETDPHVTILYGLHSEVTESDVRGVLDKYLSKRLDIWTWGIGKFDNKDYSVVKFDIHSPILHDINKDLKKLPHTTDYPNYQPHMTIAYVKSGEADKYVKRFSKIKMEVDKIVYSTTSGEKFTYKLSQSVKSK
jgi:2'-5' RNA ligase